MEIVGAALSIGMGLMQGGREKEAHERAAADQRAMAERNAQREEAEMRERERQAIDEQRREGALAKATQGASGVSVYSKTAVEYGAGLHEARQKEIDYLRKAGKSRADITRTSGEYAARTSEEQGQAAWWGGIGSGVRGALSIF